MQVWQEVLSAIQNIYGIIDQLNLSVSGLLAAIVVFMIALMFAVRELASWFFKVNDLKRDLARLHEITLQLEGELKLVQNLVAQSALAPRAAATPAPTVSVVASVAEEAPAPETNKAAPAEAASSATGASTARASFPIVH